MSIVCLDPEKLYKYASRYHGKHGYYPSMNVTARRFGCSYNVIEDACDSYTGKGYLGVAVGLRNASGVYIFRIRGHQLIEAYGD